MKKTKLKAEYSQVGKWQCISGCGACCKLAPEDRPDLDQYLTGEELKTYMKMVGEDGWCINYDHESRKCQIYEQRPSFCQVKPDRFEAMYGVEETEFNEFAIACCQQQINGVYGEDSPELKRYNQQILSDF